VCLLRLLPIDVHHSRFYKGDFMKTYAILFVLAVSLSLITCISISVDSTKEAGYEKTLQKVAILVDTGDLQVIFYETVKGNPASPFATVETSRKLLLSNLLSDRIENQLKISGIDCKGFFKTGMELNENEIDKKIADYSPNQILTVGLKEAVITTEHTLFNGIFDVTIYDTNAGKNIWRAKLQLKNKQKYSNGFSSADAKSLVDDIFKALHKDSLILNYK
jgi:hypothetical protein